MAAMIAMVSTVSWAQVVTQPLDQLTPTVMPVGEIFLGDQVPVEIRLENHGVESTSDITYEVRVHDPNDGSFLNSTGFRSLLPLGSGESRVVVTDGWLFGSDPDSEGWNRLMSVSDVGARLTLEVWSGGSKSSWILRNTCRGVAVHKHLEVCLSAQRKGLGDGVTQTLDLSPTMRVEIKWLHRLQDDPSEDGTRVEHWFFQASRPGPVVPYSPYIICVHEPVGYKVVGIDGDRLNVHIPDPNGSPGSLLGDLKQTSTFVRSASGESLCGNITYAGSGTITFVTTSVRWSNAGVPLALPMSATVFQTNPQLPGGATQVNNLLPTGGEAEGIPTTKIFADGFESGTVGAWNSLSVP